MATKKQNNEDEEEKKVIVPRKASDIQRFKLEKLMKNPAKPAYVPERPEEKVPRVFNPPEFIRNIWGSSAGAGSGDFHVYRGVRRREYARQKIETAKSEKEQKDEDFQKSLEQHKKEAEDSTAKKRAKRLKKKFRQKQAKKQKTGKKKQEELKTTKLIYGGDSSVRGDGGGRGCEVRADSTYTITEHKACKNCWHSKESSDEESEEEEEEKKEEIEENKSETVNEDKRDSAGDSKQDSDSEH